MNCPNCGTRVSDDAVICETCDFIIDPAFLGDGITNQPEADTGKIRATEPSEDDGKTKVKARPSDDDRKTKPKARSEPAEDDGKTKVKSLTASTSPPPAAPRAAPVAPAAHEEIDDEGSSIATIAAVPASVTESFYELRERFKAFARSERITTVAALAFVASLGLPWRWTEADDSVIGFLAGAWPMGLLAIYVVSAAYVRRLPQLRPYKSLFVAGAAVASLFVALGTALYLQRSFLRATVHNYGRGHPDIVWKSYPHVGCALGLLAAIAMVGGATMAYLEKDRLADS